MVQIKCRRVTESAPPLKPTTILAVDSGKMPQLNLKASVRDLELIVNQLFLRDIPYISNIRRTSDGQISLITVLQLNRLTAVPDQKEADYADSVLLYRNLCAHRREVPPPRCQ